MEYGFEKIINSINTLLSIQVLNNEIYRLILAVIVFFVVFFGLKFIMKYVHNKIKQYTKDKIENVVILILNLIKDMPTWFFFVLEIYIPLKIINLPSDIDFIINIIFFFCVTIQIIIAISKILIFSFSRLFKSKDIKENKTTQKTIHMIVNIVVWIIGILLFLTNIGVDLTPIVASLGVASIAIAFSLQSLLTDLFASFSIIISKPFDLGDYIVVGEGSTEKAGTVKDITLKATHLLNINGQEIIIPNSNILTTEVINYGKMNHRRKRFKIGVVYNTPIKKIKQIPDILKNVVEKVEFVVYEWTYLYELGNYSIDFFISYDIEQPEYVLSLDIHQKIILGILEAFEKEGIAFAFPTQTIHTPDIKNIK